MQRIAEIAACRPDAVVLREKDLPEGEYLQLAGQVMELCEQHRVPCILHSFPAAAQTLHAEGLHLPLPLLRSMPEKSRRQFRMLGTSCHSLADALEAQSLGCTYLLAGHIFPTACKPDLPPRGLEFLTEICNAVPLPVYAIGGIAPGNFRLLETAGARGGCIMSGLMQCEKVSDYMTGIRK